MATPTNLPTRADYMSGRIGFDDYYRSIYKEAGIELGPEIPFISDVRDALVSGDEHLNSIRLEIWDILEYLWRDDISRSLLKHGDAWSLAGGVCTMKQAAKDAAYRAMNTEERETCGVKGES